MNVRGVFGALAEARRMKSEYFRRVVNFESGRSPKCLNTGRPGPSSTPMPRFERLCALPPPEEGNMKKRLSRLPIRAWTTCLMALSCSLGWAQDAQRVFIQGSEVNLRGGASTSAEVVKKVTIGTECEYLEDAPKQWARLKCGEVEGFTLKSLVGTEKPNFDALMTQARDTATDAKVRLDAAARAATLEPQNEQAQELLADLFFEVNFQQLQKDKKKGGLHESFVITCNLGGSARPKKTYPECLTRELEKIEYDWHQVKFQDNDFVSAMYREGALVVYSGRISPRRGKGLFNGNDDDFNVIIESRSTSAVSDAVRLALQKAATPSRSSEAQEPGSPNQDPNYPKYDSYLEEYPGMPALNPAALQLYRSLPLVWHLLHEGPEGRYIMKTCGAIYVAQLQLDVHRRARIFFGEANSPFDNPPNALRVLDVSKDGPAYRFRVRSGKQEGLLVLTWPTNELNVSQWQREFPEDKTLSSYVVAHAKNIEVRAACNKDG